jgi:hypothetical protein
VLTSLRSVRTIMGHTDVAVDDRKSGGNCG